MELSFSLNPKTTDAVKCNNDDAGLYWEMLKREK